jgi:hypothetical protein
MAGGNSIEVGLVGREGFLAACFFSAPKRPTIGPPRNDETLVLGQLAGCNGVHKAEASFAR